MTTRIITADRASSRKATSATNPPAAIQVQTPGELERALLELLSDPVRRASLGAAARALVEANRGARAKTLAVIAQAFPDAPPNVVRPFRVVH